MFYSNGWCRVKSKDAVEKNPQERSSWHRQVPLQAIPLGLGRNTGGCKVSAPAARRRTGPFSTKGSGPRSCRWSNPQPKSRDAASSDTGINTAWSKNAFLQMCQKQLNLWERDRKLQASSRWISTAFSCCLIPVSEHFISLAKAICIYQLVSDPRCSTCVWQKRLCGMNTWTQAPDWPACDKTGYVGRIYGLRLLTCCRGHLMAPRPHRAPRAPVSSPALPQGLLQHYRCGPQDQWDPPQANPPSKDALTFQWKPFKIDSWLSIVRDQC